MPIVDNELVSDVPMESFEPPNANVGDYFLDRVKRNIAQFGDAQWIVSILKLISEIYSKGKPFEIFLSSQNLGSHIIRSLLII